MKKIMIPLFVFLFFLTLFSTPMTPTYAQVETIHRRNMIINLDEGLTTEAQFTYPAIGGGPFPGVLLIHGSGATDMDEYLPAEYTENDEPSRPFLQIAEYLSERGFAVLRYNKRGVGLNGTIIDINVLLNMTFQDLKNDAEKALNVLLEQPEVDQNDITIIGHSEGTMIAPRVAVDNSEVTKVVLMSVEAYNLYDILYYQLVDRTILYANDAIDSNNDGLLSIPEVVAIYDLELTPLPAYQLITNMTGDWLWYSGLDANEDDYLDIIEELKPLLMQSFDYITGVGSNDWMQSHFALDNNLAFIGNLTSSILILQGESDIQTPIEQAYLIEQRLTEIKHLDHTLITYPNLGHTFYPVDGWTQYLGPIEEYVLLDMSLWLKDNARIRTNYQSNIDSLTNLIYLTIGISILSLIVAIIAILMIRKTAVTKLIEGKK